ncbi:MAG: EAL domain-containing protein [Lachnospiraceae bacterium]|nr:EAL domain-containing protein [Lachnospiraceae bacterium]
MRETKEGLVYTNEKCIGCNKCIRSCSCIGANVSTEADENGRSKILVDGNLCIACGACFDVCEHNARDYIDDTDRFFEDLKKGEAISLLIAPSFPANYPDSYEKILGGLKNLGAKQILSVSFGADITTWGYVNYIEKNNFTGGISQPCPAVVGYIERYLPELIPNLFPVQSPVMCAAIYAKNVLGITDKLAFISPCIAKKLEIDDPNNKGFISYNVTFDHLINYVKTNNIYGEPYKEEIEYGLGSIYPMPGGLKENVRWLLGDDVFIRQVEGEKRLYSFLEHNKNLLKDKKTPFLFVDALNCENGCICGTGTEPSKSSTDEALYALHDIKEAVKKTSPDSAWSKNASPKERLRNLNDQFSHLKLEDYLRSYTDRSKQCRLRIPDAEELEMIYIEMNKLDENSRNINCSCCGYDSCKDMAIAIHNGINHKDNCIHYLKDMYIVRAAESDMMTGLPNASGFRTFVNHLKTNGHPSLFNAFYLNLRNFGLINSKYGKHIADDIIIKFAKLLKKKTDEDECVGRLSGDNFIIMVHKEKTDDILKVTEGIKLSMSMENKEEIITIQATAGCFDINEDEVDSEEILGRCSTALNMAKYEKHVPYVFSTLDMHSKVLYHKHIASIFADALKNGEFRPYYQPKVNTNTNTLAGAEALVRWIREGKLISPGEFIPVLEMDDNICILDFYVFEQVCKDIQKWINDGIEPVRISTNFSRRNLLNPDFSRKIEDILHKYEIPREYIEVELTETVSEKENDRLSNFISDMHEADIAMAIDDFGTGYSSLNLLRDFPADVLKLDKSFIDGHIDTKRDNVVVSNVAKMAKELDMSVITEGVESQEQVDFLKSININMVQGFLFDKPLSKEDFEKRLINKSYD